MKFEDYMLAEVQLSGKPFELPSAFFNEEDELDLIAGMEYLISRGLIYNNDVNKPTYGEELLEAHPGAHRFLESYYDAQRRAISDQLVEDGYVKYYIEDGREIYRWTQEGVEYMAQQKLKNASEE
jgi:hypothetical protein